MITEIGGKKCGIAGIIGNKKCGIAGIIGNKKCGIASFAEKSAEMRKAAANFAAAY